MNKILISQILCQDLRFIFLGNLMSVLKKKKDLRGCMNEVNYYGVCTFKGQVHGSVHAHLSKCRFPAGTCCLIYASNMIMS